MAPAQRVGVPAFGEELSAMATISARRAERLLSPEVAFSVEVLRVLSSAREIVDSAWAGWTTMA
jgi:hypothetical protein